MPLQNAVQNLEMENVLQAAIAYIVLVNLSNTN